MDLANFNLSLLYSRSGPGLIFWHGRTTFWFHNMSLDPRTNSCCQLLWIKVIVVKACNLRDWHSPGSQWRVRGHSFLARSDSDWSQNPGKRDAFCWTPRIRWCWPVGPLRRPAAVGRIPANGRKTVDAADYYGNTNFSIIYYHKLENVRLNYCQGETC